MRTFDPFSGLRRKQKTRNSTNRPKPRARRMFLEPLESRQLLTSYWYDFHLGEVSEESLLDEGFINVLRSTDDGNFNDPPDDLTINYTVTFSNDPQVASTADHTLVSDSITMYGSTNDTFLSRDYFVKEDLICEGNETITVTITSYSSSLGRTYEPSVSNQQTVYVYDDEDCGRPLPVQTLDVCTTCDSPAWSGEPVRYGDGTVLISSTDLSTQGGGIPWGITRDWSNAPGYAWNNTVGEGMVVAQQPLLLPVSEDTLAVIVDGHTAYYFDRSGNDYIARGFIQDHLTHDTVNDEYVLTNIGGQQHRFHGFSSSLPLDQQGQLKSFSDAGENEVNLTYNSGTGQLSEMQRVSTVGSTEVTESFLYEYVSGGANDGLVESILQQRKVGSGSWDIFRKVVYAYYDGVEDHGNARNLKTATIKEIVLQGQPPTEIENTIDTTYYRYYTEDTSTGYVHGLKYVFNPASYARLLAAFTDQEGIDSQEDPAVDDYADHYFEFGVNQRATKEIAQGAGCSSCTGGQGTFTFDYDDRRDDIGYEDGYNSWAMKTTETLPDGNENIVYTNFMGEVMLKVFHDADTDGPTGPDVDLGEWLTYYRYDDDGRVKMIAQPSAVADYNPNWPALLDDDEEATNFDYLNDSQGLITKFTYYETTDATATSPGGAAGYLQSVSIRQGETGTEIPQSETSYFEREAGDITIYFPAVEVAYTDDAGANELYTSYAYTFVTGKVQVESLTRTAQDWGITTQFFDAYGRPTWTKDEQGYIHYVEYDQKTGAVAKTIVDVNTDLTSTFVGDPPNDWETPESGGLHLTTVQVLDALGRPTKVTAANGDVTHMVYKDPQHEIRMYPGWNATTNATTGPTIVMRENRTEGNGYIELLTTSADPIAVVGVPTGNDAIDHTNLQTLTRTYFNAAGQATRTDDYFDFNPPNPAEPEEDLPLDYSADPHVGTVNLHYYTTEMGYDSRGHQNRVERGDGTIFRTVYDSLSRPISTWIGNADTPESAPWEPADHGDMVLQQEFEYDNGGIGDSHLTSTTDGASRQTLYFYDFRGRQIEMHLPDLDCDPQTTNSRRQETSYDNLAAC